MTFGPILDSTLPIFLEGYAWLPDRLRRSGGRPVHTRLMGQRAVGLSGPEAARFFYDEDHVERHSAVPGPVLSTLFGHGAVHTLDGADHRHRKAVFTSLMGPEGVAALVDRATAAWDTAVADWTDEVVLFDEASRVLARAVCEWTGVPIDESEVHPIAADLVALVDGFATPGPRHWRARRARKRREAWLAHLVADVRRGAATVPAGSAVEVVARHRDTSGQLLDPRVAAVELLNLLRPTVAVCWFVAFTGHALHRWPEHRARLREDDPAFAEAFAHEVRRFYPFAPFIGGRAVRDLTWRDTQVPAGSLVLLDLYGQNHDARLWDDPYTFAPQRFVDRPIGAFELVPQGAGDARTGHRCPGEGLAVALLQALSVRLARLDYDVPEQDLSISLRRIPARPRSGVVLTSGR